MKTIQEIARRIETILQDVSRTEYFTVYGVDGRQIKIRVGNHSANYRNNGDTKTISFITNRTPQRKSGYNAMSCEFEMDMETMLTDTYQTIEQVLEWEDVAEDQEAAEELYYELD